MTRKNTKNDDPLEVAASRALEHISSSAHARSQPVTPSTAQLPISNTNQSNILDIFMSPDKPKSRLRQLAENSAKKYSSRTSLPIETTTNVNQSSQSEFILNLGIPSKPPIDPKTFAFKPPSRRSLGPRRSSVVSRKSLSPTKSPKASIENLLDDLDIIDPPANLSNRRSSLKPNTKTKSNINSQQPPHHSSHDPPTTRRSRRVTIVNVSTCQTHLDTIRDSQENPSVSNTYSESVECDASDQCDAFNTQREDSDSSSSNDSFDANVLIHKLRAKDMAEEAEGPEVKTEEEEKESDDNDSIIVNPKRSSKRNQSRLNPKRVIPESDSGNADETPPPTSSKLQPSSSSRTPSTRLHQRKTSLKANQSKQKSPNTVLNDVNGSSCDDSIEILPSRALQFQKSRALALSARDNTSICNPWDRVIPEDIIKILPQDNNEEASLSEDDIKIKSTKSIKSFASDLHKPIDFADSLSKKSTKMKEKAPVKPVASESVKKVASTKKAGDTKRKPIAFSRIRDDLAEELIERLDEQVFNHQLPTELELVWSKRLNTTAGRAKWTIIKDSKGNLLREKVQIELATKVLDDETKLRNTLAHELCHVACWFIDRQKDEKHGKYFKAWARKINTTIPNIKVTTRHDYVISYKFNWACNEPECTKVYGRHSNSIDTERHVCVCGGRLVRIPNKARKAGIDIPPSSATHEATQPHHDQNLTSVDGELTEKLKNLKVVQDLIDLAPNLIDS